MLDNSKKVFLSPNCLKDKTVMERILKVLDGYKVPKDRVISEIDMNLLNSGDYVIRCFDGEVHVFETQLLLPFGFITYLVEKI